MSKNTNFSHMIFSKIYHFINSVQMSFYIITILLIQSLWVAVSAILPLPFDEYYHVGVIKIYAQQWSPWIANQTETASLYGDITRMPSYLYHYLMSFPYRILDVFIDSETVLIISLRLINIALVIGAVLIFRKLFTEAGMSKRIINIVTLVFTITPIVPFLAAHVNYDNAVILMTSISFLLAFRLVSRERTSARLTLLFVSVGMLGSLIKYTFLLLYAPLFLFVIVHFVRNNSKVFTQLIVSFKKEKVLVKSAIMFLILLSSILFVERIAINFARYSAPDPACEKVQEIEVCEKFMPWYRNNQAKLRSDPVEKIYGNPVSYSQHWASKMMRGYFAIFSHTPTNVLSPLEPFGPIVLRPIMPLPITMAYILIVAGLITVLTYIRVLWKDRLLRIIIIVSGIYLLVLIIFNYLSYLKVGAAYAIQARYTYPLLLPIFLLITTAFNQIKVARNTKMYLAVVFILLYSWGAGVTGWIIRSDGLWYWQNSTVNSVNQSTQNILKKITPH